jgi:hypothetical protein
MKKIRKLPNIELSNVEHDNNNSEKDEKNQRVNSFILFVLFMTIVYYFRDFIDKLYEVFAGTVSKKTLRKRYNVDAKTFNKWVEIFCSSTIDFEAYKKRRKLTNTTCLAIESILGTPSEMMPILSKSEIVEAADCSYELLRKAIHSHQSQFRITPEVFKSLNFFPPRIAHHILKKYKSIQRAHLLEMKKEAEQTHEKLLSRKV